MRMSSGMVFQILLLAILFDRMNVETDDNYNIILVSFLHHPIMSRISPTRECLKRHFCLPMYLRKGLGNMCSVSTSVWKKHTDYQCLGWISLPSVAFILVTRVITSETDAWTLWVRGRGRGYLNNRQDVLSDLVLLLTVYTQQLTDFISLLCFFYHCIIVIGNSCQRNDTNAFTAWFVRHVCFFLKSIAMRRCVERKTREFERETDRQTSHKKQEKHALLLGNTMFSTQLTLSSFLSSLVFTLLLPFFSPSPSSWKIDQNKNRTSCFNFSCLHSSCC